MANNGSAYGAAVDAFNTQYNPQVGQSKGSGSLWGSGNPTYSAPVPGSMVITHPSGATITLHPVASIGTPPVPPSDTGGGDYPTPSDTGGGGYPALSDTGGGGYPAPTMPVSRKGPSGPTIPVTVPHVGAPPPVFGPPLGAPPPPNPTPPSPVTVDPNSPEGLAAALPDPNQINLRNWANLSPSEKAINYGLYQVKGGWTQSDIDAAVARAGQSYNGPRAGFIAPT